MPAAGKKMNLPALPSRPEEADVMLNTIGFVFHLLSPHKISGSLVVTPKCCQPFMTLHGGVSALIADSLASFGAFFAASGLKRVFVIQLSINNLNTGMLGDLITAEATPLSVGNKIQVWEVRLWKSDPSNTEIKTLLAISKVTLYCSSEADKEALLEMKLLAKL